MLVSNPSSTPSDRLTESDRDCDVSLVLPTYKDGTPWLCSPSYGGRLSTIVGTTLPATRAGPSIRRPAGESPSRSARAMRFGDDVTASCVEPCDVRVPPAPDTTST